MNRKLGIITGALVLAVLIGPTDAQRKGKGRRASAATQQGQGGPPRTAMAALQAARERTGKEITRLVDLRGEGGMPNPPSWSMVFHDPKSSTNLSVLAPGEAPTPGDDDYAEGRPPVYFSSSRVRLDSPDAFKVANRQAAEAKVGFDYIDYQLRGRDFTEEPVWTLRLLDDEEELVGIVEMSGESGEVLRTIWLRRDTERGTVRVTDSALTGGPPRNSASEGAGAAAESELKALPPLRNLEPPPETTPPKVPETTIPKNP